MIELFEFQRAASESICDRFLEYLDDPVIVGTAKRNRRVPFFQALDSLTASGKTVILADAVSTMCEALPVPPLILWLSKGRVVVEQALANLLPGGKYHHLLGNAEVRALAEFDATEVDGADVPQVFFATVGTFNQKDKEAGNRLIYRSDIDTAEQSTWSSIKARRSRGRQRRPLLIVYDEAHNLTDQQTDILMELEPDAFLLASATIRLPAKLNAEVEELRRAGKSEKWLVTRVQPKAVADSGLVKSTVILGGYQAPMEETVSALIADLRQAEEDAERCGIEGRPKAIYISNTNIVEGNAFLKDDTRRPFAQRQAPPILIWRFLTESCDVDPSEIAVYCSLQFNRDFPPPPEFVHFKGGDQDYEQFTRGNYRHVIFNLSLQEGWDDPFCYFAYIDKSMESRAQVQQVIGRVLRQPGARHYSAERLNTAHFYIRVDRREVWNELLADVKAKLSVEAPEIRFLTTTPGKKRPEEYKAHSQRFVPTTAYNPREAVEPIAKLIAAMTDYRNDDGTNVRAEGSRKLAVFNLSEQGFTEKESESFAQSNLVSARWVFQREVRRRYHGALQVASTAESKFDARIGIGSNAYHHMTQLAERVVEAYLENVELVQKRVDPYEVGSILARPDEVLKFEHALHDGYEELNGFELDFAQCLDNTKLAWCRNPSRTGYGIPLITIGSTSTFYPDFLVWKKSTVFALDTKGGHVLHEAVARKLLRIETTREADQRIAIRFISRGKWNVSVAQESQDGVTIWGLKQDGTRRAVHFDDIPSALKSALKEA